MPQPGRSRLKPPYLKRATLLAERVKDWSQHPFDLPLFADHRFDLAFTRPVTAESYFNFISQMDELDKDPGAGPRIVSAYGGRSLHTRSHGEAFLALFEHRFAHAQGIYILDEPEAALSPRRQIRFLNILRRMEEAGRSQIIIASHAPLIIGYPGADLLIMERDGTRRGRPEDTSHWRVVRDYFADPDGFMRAAVETTD